MVGWKPATTATPTTATGAPATVWLSRAGTVPSAPAAYQSCADGGQDAGEASVCGDGVISPGEQCDDGDLNTDQGYGTCTTRCKIGPFCGDGQVNGPEECDLGSGNGKVDGKGGCSFGYSSPHYCGDSIIDSDRGEQCDLGDLNGVPLDPNGQPSDTGMLSCTKNCLIPFPQH